jgi:hypothetical protein
MLGAGDPFADDLVELYRRHARMSGDHDRHQGLFAAGEYLLHVTREQRCERLLLLPLRVLRGERLHTIEREKQLSIKRLLGP